MYSPPMDFEEPQSTKLQMPQIYQKQIYCITSRRKKYCTKPFSIIYWSHGLILCTKSMLTVTQLTKFSPTSPANLR